MWLLNVTTRELEHFLDPTVVPGYAILSHTWDEDEPTFEDLRSREAETRKGYLKIDYTCRQALDDGYDYAWVDTVCIDKRSSAELSEAINSMFRWYRSAKNCYVYLMDVAVEETVSNNPHPFEGQAETKFCKSRWFSRSWTLQELIAPHAVRFYDHAWNLLGTKHALENTIYEVTRIDIEVLRNSNRLSSMSVAKRMSWAALRSASREEDQAYSLLGLFDIAMPMLYGEGGVKAFQRLQEEIIRSSAVEDHSILAWKPWSSMPDDNDSEGELNARQLDKMHGLFAPTPYGFRHAHNIVSWASSQLETFQISHNGIRISVALKSTPFNTLSVDYYASLERHGQINICLAALRCRYADQPWRHIMLQLSARPTLSNWLDQSRSQPGHLDNVLYDILHTHLPGDEHVQSVHVNDMQGYSKQTVTLARRPPITRPVARFVQIRISNSLCAITGSAPADAWLAADSMLKLSETEDRALSYYAAVELSTTRSILRHHQRVTVNFAVGRGYDRFPTARVCPCDSGPLKGKLVCPKRCYHEDKIILPWSPALFRVGQSMLQITAKLILVTGERVWSFELTVTKMGFGELVKECMLRFFSRPRISFVLPRMT